MIENPFDPLALFLQEFSCLCSMVIIETALPIGEYAAVTLLIFFGLKSLKDAWDIPSNVDKSGEKSSPELDEYVEAEELLKEKVSKRLSNPLEIVWKSFSLVFFAVIRGHYSPTNEVILEDLALPGLAKLKGRWHGSLDASGGGNGDTMYSVAYASEQNFANEVKRKFPNREIKEALDEKKSQLWRRSAAGTSARCAS